MTRISVAAALSLLLACAAETAQAQGASDWNRSLKRLQTRPGSVVGSLDFLVDWELVAVTGGTGADVGTEIELRRNGGTLSVLTVTVFDPGLSSGGANPGTCSPTACGGGCGSIVVDTTAAPLTCTSAPGGCGCRTGHLTAVFPDVVPVPGDEIMVLLRPAPGAVPDADPSDDQGVFTVDTWNRRVVSLRTSPGSSAGLHDVTVAFTLDLEGSSTLGLELGTNVSISVDGVPQANTDNPECIIWDIADSCASGPDGEEIPLVCGPGGCSLPTTVLVFPDIPVDPGESLGVTLVPIPGALPELPGFPGDDEKEGVFPFPVPALPLAAAPLAAGLLLLAARRLASARAGGSSASASIVRSWRRNRRRR